jgi:hypothetical protein
MLHAPANPQQWHGRAGAVDANRIISFLGTIGISVGAGTVGDSVLRGMTVRNGAIVVDPAVTAWPGDLLHEAGHIAMTDPADRMAAEAVSTCPGEEMGAIAWSVAAAFEIGVSLDVLFHEAGYRGSGASHSENFGQGHTFGVPMLALYGLTAEPHRAEEQGVAPYPAMQKWLR